MRQGSPPFQHFGPSHPRPLSAGDHKPAPDCKTLFYPESRFGGFTDIDTNIIFFTRAHALLTPESVVLDIGCGRGRWSEDDCTVRRDLRTFRGKCQHVIGVDVDVEASQNPFVDEFHLVERAGTWPIPDRSVDLAISASVLEHVEDPELFFSECSRVVKPGGFLCIRTTNVHSYSGVAARLIPSRYHAAVIKHVQAHPRGEADVFPTLYRCNTVSKVRHMLDRFGFEHCVYGYQSQPTSLAFSRFFYFWGMVHQHVAPHFLKPTIFAFARKLEPAGS